MIRLLDRYVLATFLLALGLFAVGFLVLFVAVDFAPKLGRFLELQNVQTLPFIVRYYLVRLPLLLTILLPAVVLFASIFTLLKLARNNEILPIVAAGTSLRRTALPFLLAAAGAAGAIAALEEWVLPGLRDEIADSDDILSSRERSWSVILFDARTHLYAFEYDHVRRRMQRVHITVSNADSRTVEIVRAAECRWEAGRSRWVAYEGAIEQPGRLVEKKGERPQTFKEPIPPEGYVVPGSFKLDDVRRSSVIGRFSFSRLSELIDRAREYPHVPAFRVKVHGRLAFPISPLLLTLLGMPFVVSGSSKSFIKGIFLCFLLALSFYVLYFACLDLGNKGTLPPAAAAWGPTGAFGLAGLAAFARMRT